MSEKTRGKRCAGDRAGQRPDGRGALAIMLVMGSVACGESSVRPPATGSITLATETTGFMKDDGYDLLVDGESQGSIGANEEVTLAELDPATYEVALGDVAPNCTVEATSVEVLPEETAQVAMTIVCSYPEPASYTVKFGRDRPDLDTGEIIECPFTICPTDEEWDVWVYENTQTTPRSVIRQNEDTAVEIAHLTGVTLDALTEEDVAGATFTTLSVAEPFDAERVILIRTDGGAVYALGNPSEDATEKMLTFDAALVGEPPE